MGLLGGSSAFLGLMALGLLVLLMVGKILTVLELREKGQMYRKNTHRITELEEDLDTSRRRYLIALEGEGVGKNKVSQLKTRLAGLKQHMEQIEMSEVKEQARRHQEKEKALEMSVLQALGGPSQRDSYFHRVMNIITQLIDVSKLESNDDIIQAVQVKLAECTAKIPDRASRVRAAVDSVAAKKPPSET